ncbi:MAG: hypothetical protein ACT4UP_06350 [Gammaproteobacteria bacterium]
MAVRHRTETWSPPRTAALAFLAGLMIAACERATPPPADRADTGMNWARAALERNPELEVLAVDAGAAVFTVRDRRTGEVRVVKLNELAAAPAAWLAPAATTPAAMDVAQTAVVQAAETAAAPEDATQTGIVESVPAAATQLDYTVERQGDGIRVTGPGLSIVSAPAPGAVTARGEAGQQIADPIICEGSRMMQLDNRRIFVDGDAITARAGCELHITNSRIVASRTGVVVQDATVHISNSYVEGRNGAYYAGAGSRVFLRDTTLNGVRRRDTGAEIRELAGGEWQ